MKPIKQFPRIDRRVLLSSLAMLPLLSASLRSTTAVAQTQRDPLPSWNEGATKSVDPRLRRARHDARRA